MKSFLSSLFLLFFVVSLQAQTVGPLLTTAHGFQRPYNRFCPYWLYDWGKWSPTRTQAGCVAAAAEQAMTYYRRPVAVMDTIAGWANKHYTIDTIYPGEVIETASIRDFYTDEDDSVATHNVARLMYVIAVACRMNFGLEASGSSLRRLVEPLQRVFGYKYARFIDSYDYTPDDWAGILRREIDHGRPVVYAAYTQHLGGHAFVIDGYDGDSLFHVNWAFEGSYNGWFRLDHLSFAEPLAEPTASGKVEGFFCNAQALLLCPDEVDDVLPEPLQKTGSEIRFDKVEFLEEPLTERYTPVRVTLTNTADIALTTPFEFFTNLPTDTALFYQGDYNALSGINLQPHETQTITVHLQFDEDGERIFHASPDDSTLLCAVPVNIQTAPAAVIGYDEPQLSFPQPGMVQILQGYRADIDGGRAGTMVTYEIYDAEDATASHPRHYYHLYVHPGETATDTVTFRGLQPGHTYAYRLRHPWEIRHEVFFTLPTDSPTGIPQAPTDVPQPSRAYDLQGRPLTNGARQHGVYIERGTKRLRR